MEALQILEHNVESIMEVIFQEPEGLLLKLNFQDLMVLVLELELRPLNLLMLLKQCTLMVNSHKIAKTNYSTYTPSNPLPIIPTNSDGNKPPLLPTPPYKYIQNALPRPFKFILVEIRAIKMAQGDQKYERGHTCQSREPQLFTVEIPIYESELKTNNEEDQVHKTILYNLLHTST